MVFFVGVGGVSANADTCQRCGQRRKDIVIAHTKIFMPNIVAMNVHVVTGYGMMP